MIGGLVSHIHSEASPSPPLLSHSWAELSEDALDVFRKGCLDPEESPNERKTSEDTEQKNEMRGILMMTLILPFFVGDFYTRMALDFTLGCGSMGVSYVLALGVHKDMIDTTQ